MQDFVARQDLRHAGIGFSALFDGSKELAVLQFNAVHGNVHFGHIDLLFFAGVQVVVTGQVSAGVTDVTEVSTQGAVVVEAERQGAGKSDSGLYPRKRCA